MKLLSWNVNGIRAATRTGLRPWVEATQPDALCLQEIKARPDQLEPAERDFPGYQAFWHPAERPGYSGVATFTRETPLEVHYGLGEREFDCEGRVLRLEFRDYVLVNAYFPNSQRDHARLGYKLEFCAAMLRLLNQYRRAGKNVFLCGDYNISHRALDLANPKSNEKNAGFLPEERAWFDRLLAHGWIDTFRALNSEGGHYTWWSYRPGVRARNIGWRLDYFVTNPEAMERVQSVRHLSDVLGSDHCPVELELKR